MDEVLKILEKNARISIADLEKMTGRQKADIAKTIARYEKNGTIIKYKAVLNTQKTAGPKGVSALIEVKVAPQKDVGFDGIAQRIYKFREVKSCYLLSGTYDLLLVVEGKDIHAVAGFVSEKLAPLDAVKGTFTHFMLKKYKEDGVVLVDEGQAKRLAITY